MLRHIEFPSRLNLAQTPTPLQPLDRLSSQLGGPRLWIKRDDLTGSHLSGNKIRKLEFVIAEAVSQGCDTLITCGGLQSNHCRVTALLGAQLGLKVRLLLRGLPQTDPSGCQPDGNLLLDYLSGAEISYYPEKGFSANLPARFQHWQQEYQAQGRKAFSIPIGASDGIGAWGYLACCQELQADFKTHNISPEFLVCASGSGGTQAGLTLGSHFFDLNAQVLGFAVCDNEAYFQQKVDADIVDWQQRYQPESQPLNLSIQVNDQYIGPGYGVATDEIFETISWVARTEGVVLDPVYTGKAFHGLVEEIRKGSFSNCSDIVFIHTGGIFGLFPQRNHFCFSGE